MKRKLLSSVGVLAFLLVALALAGCNGCHGSHEHGSSDQKAPEHQHSH